MQYNFKQRGDNESKPRAECWSEEAVTHPRLTRVLPFCILCKSLWAWAQKSRQAVTPENGRPSFNPRRHSGALCSYSICMERQDRFHWVLQDTECTRNALLWQRAGLPHILEVTTSTSWRQIKLQQFNGHFVSMLHSSLLCSLVPSVSGVIVKLANNTFPCVLLLIFCQGLVFLHDKCSAWFPWLALWEWYVCVDWKYTKLLWENGFRKLTSEWLNEK